ncbi:alanine racemase [Candidatus Saccharibacteria bacterium]|nr:alanine racemase [Candidatus Saccharibacteria bacterium]
MLSRLKPLNTVLLHRANLYHNLSLFQNLVGEQQVIPMLKGNAYGHGIHQVAEMLDGQVEMVAVDSYFEALEILPYFRGRILCLGFILPENYRLLKNHHIEYVIQRREDLEALAATGKRFRVHMEINTGMNRMGLPPGEIDAYLDVLERNPQLHLAGVMTHLSCASEVDGSVSGEQMKRFDEVVDHVLERGFRPDLVHAMATAGVPRYKSRHTNAVRVGLGLYGANPLDEEHPNYGDLAGLRPVLGLETTVVQINHLEPGDAAGYNAAWVAERPSRLATVPIGYYECLLPRGLVSRGHLLYGDQRLPIVGRICMNHTILDVTDCPEVERGATVSVPFLELARELELSPYEALIHVSSTIRREIV